MMDKWTACEEAYKNGYEQGKKDAVGHAHWEEVSPVANCGLRCSHCKARIRYKDYYSDNHIYCYKCGFMMDGEENG